MARAEPMVPVRGVFAGRASVLRGSNASPPSRALMADRADRTGAVMARQLRLDMTARRAMPTSTVTVPTGVWTAAPTRWLPTEEVRWTGLRPTAEVIRTVLRPTGEALPMLVMTGISVTAGLLIVHPSTLGGTVATTADQATGTPVGSMPMLGRPTLTPDLCPGAVTRTAIPTKSTCVSLTAYLRAATGSVIRERRSAPVPQIAAVRRRRSTVRLRRARLPTAVFVTVTAVRAVTVVRTCALAVAPAVATEWKMLLTAWGHPLRAQWLGATVCPHCPATLTPT
jgi:hypothetical protein